MDRVASPPSPLHHLLPRSPIRSPFALSSHLPSPSPFPSISFSPTTPLTTSAPIHTHNASSNFKCLISPSVLHEPPVASGGDGPPSGGDGGRGDDGSGNWGGGADDDGHPGSAGHDHGLGGVFGAFLEGWRARTRTDPQFAYKVLMEEIVGVGACVLGDMASRPNFGLNELDFVFSTLVVGSIVNFSLMYLLAPTSGSASGLPGVFASCPPGHMFEPGPYSTIARAGTFVYKGVVFAAVGFAAGLVGTAISTLLLEARKKVDPDFVPQNKPPPTLLNAATWALHMGFSSNFRYQALNGLEFSLEKVLPPGVFKASVIATRGLNNVIGGTTFVMLARLTGSQKAGADSPPPECTATCIEEEGNTVDQVDGVTEKEPEVVVDSNQ